MDNTSQDIPYHSKRLHSEGGTTSNCVGNIVRCMVVAHVGHGGSCGEFVTFGGCGTLSMFHVHLNNKIVRFCGSLRVAVVFFES